MRSVYIEPLESDDEQSVCRPLGPQTVLGRPGDAGDRQFGTGQGDSSLASRNVGGAPTPIPVGPTLTPYEWQEDLVDDLDDDGIRNRGARQ